MKKKAIFFDNDGILVNTEPLYFQASRTIFQRFGFNLSMDIYKQEILAKGTRTTDIPPSGFFAMGKDIKFLELRDKYYWKLCREQDIQITGAKEVLEDLKEKKFIVAAVTAAESQNFKCNHEKTKIIPLLDFYITRDDVAISKPHPEPYLKALEVAKVKPEEALVIEDSSRGLQAAVSAGIECWVIPTELTKHQDFSQAKKVLNNILEIKKLLL